MSRPGIWLLFLALTACGSSPPVRSPVEPPAVVAALSPTWWRAFDDPVLERLVNRGLAANLDLAVAAERIREQRALRRELAGARYPALVATGSHGHERSTANGRDEDYFYGLELSWEIDLFGRLAALERSAAAVEAASRADREALRVSLAGEIATSYVQLRLAQREEAIALGTADVQDETARITRVRFEQGAVSGYDVDRLEAQAELTRAAVPLARTEAARLTHALAELLDLPPSQLVVWLSGIEELPRQPAAPAVDALLALPAAALDSRPDVQATLRRLDAAGADLQAAQALRYPQVSLGALLGFAQGSAQTNWSLSGGLVQPLFDFGRIRASIESADARQQQAWLAYRNAQNRAAREVRDALVGYGQGQVRQRILTTAVARSTSATAVARRQYEAGTLSSLEVLDSQRTQFDARLAEVRARAEVVQRWVEVHRALGRVTQ